MDFCMKRALPRLPGLAFSCGASTSSVLQGALRTGSGYPLLGHPLPISAETLLFAGQHLGLIRVNICCVACQGWVGLSFFFSQGVFEADTAQAFFSGNCSLWASFA
jgi:hypothetical protein